MQIEELVTPSILVEQNILANNIEAMAQICSEQGKELWPMVKTHKSSEVAKLQAKAGAAGFLTGTLDEAELLVSQGVERIMLAYPVAGQANLARLAALARQAKVLISLDGLAAAEQLQAYLVKASVKVDYLIIVDSGLHRFGVAPQAAVSLVKSLAALTQLRFRGIATHPGHVYGQSSYEGVKTVAAEEAAALQATAKLLASAGYPCEMIATGSTPTAALVSRKAFITALRPGNYVYNDAIQVSLGVATEADCALTVLATVIAQPQEDVFLIDAGSKCFGLDKGAHSVSLVSGYGLIQGHPELVLESLSEEVGKIKVLGATTVQVGQKLTVIPNHSCSAANMTNFLVLHEKGRITGRITVDARGNSKARF
ncbi:MAG: alanine racemase [Sporomusaceae bacterium]|nr:alanine racemase [Sporomusaceae bacterium]